jgi:hypothetical protein
VIDARRRFGLLGSSIFDPPPHGTALFSVRIPQKVTNIFPALDYHNPSSHPAFLSSSCPPTRYASDLSLFHMTDLGMDVGVRKSSGAKYFVFLRNNFGASRPAVALICADTTQVYDWICNIDQEVHRHYRALKEPCGQPVSSR